MADAARVLGASTEARGDQKLGWRVLFSWATSSSDAGHVARRGRLQRRGFFLALPRENRHGFDHLGADLARDPLRDPEGKAPRHLQLRKELFLFGRVHECGAQREEEESLLNQTGEPKHERSMSTLG